MKKITEIYNNMKDSIIVGLVIAIIFTVYFPTKAGVIFITPFIGFIIQLFVSMSKGGSPNFYKIIPYVIAGLLTGLAFI